MPDTPLVLCADDDEDILALVSVRVERLGFRAVQATNGEDALNLARELKPDLAILDVMMPRRTGTEVLRELRADESTRGIPVVLLSARAQETDVSRGLDAGADAYLAKPFTARELIETVEQLLAAQSLR